MYIGIIYNAIKWADDPEPDRLVCIVKDPDPKKTDCICGSEFLLMKKRRFKKCVKKYYVDCKLFLYAVNAHTPSAGYCVCVSVCEGVFSMNPLNVRSVSVHSVHRPVIREARIVRTVGQNADRPFDVVTVRRISARTDRYTDETHTQKKAGVSRAGRYTGGSEAASRSVQPQSSRPARLKPAAARHGFAARGAEGTGKQDIIGQ